MALCPTCEGLSSALHKYFKQDAHAFSRMILGSLEDLRSRPKCQMCRFLAQGLESVIDEPIRTSEPCKSLELTADKHGVIYIQNRSHPTVPHLHLLPLERSSASLSGRLIGAQCDMALLRKWLECCEAWHGPDCFTPGWLTGGRFPETAPFRLIDVQQQCLVRSRIESRYIALSYVWGKIEGLIALRENLSLLEQPLGLAKLQHMIPRTVCDAMTLVRLLGERYVWIDSLCIVQDDPEERHSLIANMDAVYGNAVLTVNAADGRDADAGLSGLPTTPRQTAQAVFEYCANQHLIIGQPLLTDLTDHCRWNTRAWTYQERFLSKRTLTFTANQVYFECQRMIWCEDVAGEIPDVVDYFQMENFLPIDWSPEFNDHMYKLHYSLHVEKSTDWVEYLRTVEEYTPRQLSFDSDMLAAFAGMSRVLEHMFNSPFLCGLPESLFHCALLWQPEEKLSRRTADADNADSFPCPTWSWAGWKGKIIYEDIMPHLKMLSGDLVKQTKPLTTWEKQTADGTHRAPIATVGEIGKFLLADFPERLPAGWHDSSGGPSDIFIDTYFYHESAPNKFHAIPTPDLRSETEHHIPWKRIATSTESATLYLQRPHHTDPPPPRDPPRLNIVDRSGTWLGSLLLDSADDVDVATPHECIALSEGGAPKPEIERPWSAEEWTPVESSGDTWYFFVNVMLVERHGGIARRAGIGKIDRTKWSGLSRSVVEVVLE